MAADFALLGPIKPTPSHDYAPGLGWRAFTKLSADVALPVYAVGGLNAADVAESRAHGGQGIAAIRGLWPRTLKRAPQARINNVRRGAVAAPSYSASR